MFFCECRWTDLRGRATVRYDTLSLNYNIGANNKNPGLRTMFDFKRTLSLIKGAIFDSEPTWDSYLSDAGDWKKTALLLTGPLVVGSGILSYILGVIFPSRLPFYPSPSFLDMLLGIVVSAIAAVVIAFVVAILAGLFKGKNSFPLALAATSLAFVPGYLGSALIHLPWLGGLLALALGIYGLVLLWRILPKYLEVPIASRVGHYILSLVASVVALFVLGTVVGTSPVGVGTSGFEASKDGGFTRDRDSNGAPSGLFGTMERQGRIMEAADADTYDPPGNGKLSKAQVKNYISVMTKTRDYRIAQTQELEELSKKAEEDEIASISEAFSGMTGIMGITTAEMEVVKTGNGNWAEHQWIKEQLHIARIQKDINDAVIHNYKLYLEFEEELRELEHY